MSVPKLGTYTAIEQGIVQYKFTIESADPEPGDIRGKYWTKGSLMGEWDSPLGDYPADRPPQPERSSSYSWLAPAEHEWRINQPPFLIRIVGTASKADGDGYQTCQHSWTGVYHSDDTILMSGTECYIVFDADRRVAKQEVISLPDLTFKLS